MTTQLSSDTNANQKTAVIAQRDNGKFTLIIRYADGSAERIGGYKTHAAAVKKASAWGCVICDSYPGFVSLRKPEETL